MDNVVLDSGPGHGYHSLITGGDNSQLEDFKACLYHSVIHLLEAEGSAFTLLR